MRSKSLTSLVAICLLTISSYAGEIKVAENPVPANSYAVVTYFGAEAGDDIKWDIYPEPTRFDDLGKGTLVFNGPSGTKYRVTADVVNFDKKTRSRSNQYVTIGGAPAPPVPPGPNPPGPNPPDPLKPDVPVTSFRVIYIVESGQTLTSAQYNTIYAKSVRDYLTAKTNRDGTGWRVWDKDQKVGNEATILQSMWSAVLPKVTTTPCVAIEVNGKVEIVPLPSSPEDNLALLKKYAEGK